MHRLSQLFALIVCALALASCTTVPETGRSALNLFSEEQVASMSLKAFDDMKRELPVSRNPIHRAQVDRVGNRIARALTDEYPDAEWEFVVFDDEQVNAFAMAGGKVGIYTGLLDLVDSDDELAAVVGHEIAHVTMRHSNERMSQQALAAGVGVLLNIGTRDMDSSERDLVMAAYGAGSTVGLLLPYSRLHESEADEIGLRYMALAGYNPQAAISFWEKMEAQGGAGVPELLSTHPSDNSRIEQLKELVPTVMPIYEANSIF